MSISTEKPKSPCTRYFEWNGNVDNGHFKYYDKEQKKEIVAPMPFSFIVLDELTTIKGFSKADDGFYFSNEVRNTSKDILSVKTKKGLKASGVWIDIKGQLTGSDFCKSVYVMHNDNGTFKIGNVSIMKSALTGWFDFCKANVLSKCWVNVSETIKNKNGVVTFLSPKYDAKVAGDAEIKAAKELDLVLQEYLTSYLAPVVNDGLTDEERDIQSQAANLG